MSIFAFASLNCPAREGSALDDEAAATSPRAQSACLQLPPTAAATFARRQSALTQSGPISQPQIPRRVLEDRAGDCVDRRHLCRRALRGQAVLHRQSRLQAQFDRSADGWNVATRANSKRGRFARERKYFPG